MVCGQGFWQQGVQNMLYGVHLFEKIQVKFTIPNYIIILVLRIRVSRLPIVKVFG